MNKLGRSTVAGLAALGLVLSGYAFARAQSGYDPAAEARRVRMILAQTSPGPQPDINSPSWKPISDDLGLWVTESERFGLQARLYVRVAGLWLPVAVDGTREMHGVMPVR